MGLMEGTGEAALAFVSVRHPAPDAPSKSVVSVLSLLCWQHSRDRFIFRGIWRKPWCALKRVHLP